MKLARRHFLRLAAGAAVLSALPRFAQAETYPGKPVRIVVGLGPGSASDILARLIGQRLSERLGQPFLIENRPGASGSLAAEAVTRASPDGYTLLLCTSNDFNRGIMPIAGLASGPLVQVVHPSFPAKTIPEFIAYAKANPGKINFGSAGIGTVVQLAGELFKTMAGVDMVHVPYQGLPSALTDLLSGQVQVVFSTLPPAMPHVRAGKLRALAVTSSRRFEALSDVPTVGDFLPGYEASFVNGLGAPKNTRLEIVDRLNKETNVALADPVMKARLAGLGAVPIPMTAADFHKLLADESEKWGKVMHAANIKMN